VDAVGFEPTLVQYLKLLPLPLGYASKQGPNGDLNSGFSTENRTSLAS
jgi:hypothetical protein